MAKVEKKLQNYLVLNKYLSSLFGFKDIEDFRKLLKSNVSEGISQNKKMYYTEVLQTLNIDEEFRQKLNQYDENIQEYLDHINQKKDPPIVLKYFQYLAVLFTEIYLDKYYNEFEKFYSEFTKYVLSLNTKEKKTGIYTYSYPKKEYMNKLCLWSATGSGKTYFMHINFLQIQRYNNKKFDNFLLITPNEGLTEQHLKELNQSSIENKRFETQRTLEDWSLKNPLKVLEIHKIKKEVSSQDGKTIPVEAFGENNIIFVDEGHKGNTSDAKTWISLRKEIVGKHGFTFEYSATFGEITSNEDTFNEYASSIIFDYRYKYFYEDGFGKDYNILNLKNQSEYGDEYFTGAILSLYEQKLYFNNYKRQIKPFNLENPLMIFVGSSVSGKKNDSDVVQVIRFLARFVNEKDVFNKLIKNILTDKSALVDTYDRPLFSSKFPYLRDLISNKTKLINDIYDEITSVLFHKKTSKTLQLIELKNAEGEIGLKFDSEYFGVINIGDVSSFIKLVEGENDNYYQVGQKSNFEQSLFHKIEKKNSPINFLIGSKKFIEGWSSFRVSSMGLLNIGKKEGSQIIQLFGRGVRLKGYNNLLKRSYEINNENLIPSDVSIPTNVTILETLNIFGLNANYMAVFKETLKEEGIEEYERIVLEIKSHLPIKPLYVPRSSEEIIDFNNSVQIVRFDQDIANVKMDLSSKIDILKSTKEFNQVDANSPLKEHIIDENVINLIDFQSIYVELLKYKDLKKYANIYFSKTDLKNILLNKSNKYKILCKKEILELNNYDELEKIKKIQDYITQLLKSYIDKIYNHEKYHWYQKNLNYDAVTGEDGSLIPKKYIFTVNSDEKSMIDDIRDFTNQLKSFIRVNSIDKDDIYTKDIPFIYGVNKVVDFFAMNIHLFRPLIYKSNDKNLEFVKISPMNLVKSERDFIINLDSFLEENKNKLNFDDVYLLRNPSRKGIGFFETKNFYPDFILWTIKGDEQTVTFIEPHGLSWESIEDEKFNLYNEIKTIESDLNNKSNMNIKLNAFILSATNSVDLIKKWNITKAELQDKNILFLDDGDLFLKQMFEKILDEEIKIEERNVKKYLEQYEQKEAIAEQNKKYKTKK